MQPLPLCMTPRYVPTTMTNRSKGTMLIVYVALKCAYDISSLYFELHT